MTVSGQKEADVTIGKWFMMVKKKIDVTYRQMIYKGKGEPPCQVMVFNFNWEY